MGKYVEPVAVAFREGGGVPYAEYIPEFTGVMDALGRGVYDGLLLDAYLPLAPGLVDRLRAGARAADVACGTGHALVLLGRAFPASTFVGYDLDEKYVEIAEQRVADVLAVRDQVGAPPDAGFASRAAREGKAAQKLAEEVLTDAGFTITKRRHRVPKTGVTVSFSHSSGTVLPCTTMRWKFGTL